MTGRIRLITLFLSCGILSDAGAQWYEQPGHPRSLHYVTDVYPGDHFNWDIAQGADGIMYAANAWGIMAFDGASWQIHLLPVPQKTAASLALSRGDTLFVGGDSQIGFIQQQADGEFVFASLTARVPADARNFSLVNHTVAVDDGVFFGTRRQIMRWSGGTISVWDDDAPYGILDDAQGTVVVQGGSGSVYQFVGESWTSVLGMDAFAERIVAVLPVGERLLFSTESGLWETGSGGPRRVEGSATEWIRSVKTTTGLALRDGTMGIATLDGDVGIVSASGDLLSILEVENAVSAPPSSLGSLEGVDDLRANRLFEDREGVLWTAMSSGIMRTDLRSPITEYRSPDGLEGQVRSVDAVGDRVLAATSRGTLEITAGPPGENELRLIPGVEDSWVEIDAGDRSIVRGRSGVFERNGRSVRQIFGAVRELVQASKDPLAFWLINDDGLHRITLDRTSDSWTAERRVFGIDGRIWRIAREPDQVLWLGFQPVGVVRLQLDAFGQSVLEEERYMDLSNFEGGGHPLRFFEHDGRVLFLSTAGVLEFAGASSMPQFRYAQAWNPPGAVLGPESNVRAMYAAPDGSIVAESAGRVYRLSFPEDAGSPVGAYLPGLRGVRLLGTAPPNSVWMTRMERQPSLVHYDLDRIPAPTSFSTMMRRVSSSDSLLDLGKQADLGFGQPITFGYSAPSFVGGLLRFRHQLDGLTGGWSDWAMDFVSSYDRLPVGAYTFRVQAQNGLGAVGEEVAFQFSVLPPWYRSPLMLGFWLLGLAGLVLGVVGVRTRRLERRAGALERVVHARTAELREKTEELERLNELRSRFFANISHEFRTPLTLTFGPLDDLLANRHGPLTDGLRRVILRSRRNGHRLLRLINQLLDLSRLEAGTLHLHALELDLAHFLRQICALFESFAQRQNVEFVVESLKDPFSHVCDPDKVEKIVVNLLSNAFKFTPAGGKVALALSRAVDNAALIKVSDTGRGIAATDLPRVFDRFYQVDGSSTRSTGGSGIGLAIVKDLTELHGGSVSVDSTVGFGSRFGVTLPMGEPTPDSAYRPESDPDPIPMDFVDTGQEGDSEVRDPTTMVLVVEDNPDMRAYIRESLDEVYAVAEAENGAFGLDRAVELIPDLVICDVMMPEMDGYELCAALRADLRTSHIPIILLTALASTENRIEGLEHGADSYLSKPFNADELRVRVRKLIEQRHALRAKWSGEKERIHAESLVLASLDSEFLGAVAASIEANMSDSAYTVDRLAEDLAMSRRQLLRKLRALTDESPSELLRRMRIERAAQMIDQRAGSIKEITYAVGYQSISHFAKAFKARVGVNPSDYAAQADMT